MYDDFVDLLIDRTLSRTILLFVTYCRFASILLTFVQFSSFLEDSFDILKAVPVKWHSWKREWAFYLLTEY